MNFNYLILLMSISKIFIYLTFLIITFSVTSHEIQLDDKNAEEIINTRMKKMSMINKLSQVIYKQLNSEDLVALKENTLKLKHAASEFKELFPINTKSENAKKLIWGNKKLFNQYNDNFMKDIELMIQYIDAKNIESLKESFNQMAANCSSCHKKFKNKK